MSPMYGKSRNAPVQMTAGAIAPSPAGTNGATRRRGSAC
jgi:hypothetical protein